MKDQSRDSVFSREQGKPTIEVNINRGFTEGGHLSVITLPHLSYARLQKGGTELSKQANKKISNSLLPKVKKPIGELEGNSNCKRYLLDPTIKTESILNYAFMCQ